MRRLGIVLLLFSFYSYSESISEEHGFIFTAPNALAIGKKESGCLSLHGKRSGKVNITVNIEVKNREETYTSTTKKIMDAENTGCFDLRLPNINITNKYYMPLTGKLHLKLKFDQSNQTINSVEEVLVYNREEITFIQTDKEIYAPGDRVRIRILLLSPDLGVPKNSIISVVKIINPIGIAIGQWENVSTEYGLVQLEHQLSQDTIMGQWQINLPDETKFFEVKEYVLPRFTVNFVDLPQALYYKADTFNFTLCARYSYGENVKGTAHIKVKLNEPFRRYHWPVLLEEVEEKPELTINQIKELKTGCAVFSIKNEELLLNFKDSFNPEFGSSLDLTGSVTEQGSDQTEITNGYIGISNEKYQIDFLNVESYFQKGLPYKGQVKITSKYGDLTNETLKLCYNPAIATRWNFTKDICSDFAIPKNNIVPFTIIPFEDNIDTIKIQAKINPTGYHMEHYVRQWHSPSNSHLKISQNTTDMVKCKTWQPFNVLYTLNDTLKNNTITFSYLVLSKGSLIKYGELEHVPTLQDLSAENYENVLGNSTTMPKLSIGQLTLSVKIHQKMYSGAELIVYYIRSDGEIVTNNIEVKVEDCLNNKVEASWSSNQKQPGEMSIYKIKASSGSWCATGAIDRKIEYMAKPKNPELQEFLNNIKYRRPINFRSGCTPSFYNPGEEEPPFWDLRRKRSVMPFYGYNDNYSNRKMFKTSGLLVMTDLKLDVEICNNFRRHMMRGPSMGGMPGGSMMVDSVMAAPVPESYSSQMSYDTATNEVQPTTIRSYFPETWLWELTRIGKTGEAQLKKPLPDAITEWVGNTFCVSPTAGFGIAKTATITGYQPFFVDLVTPYSIKRNEILHLKVLVFNYLNHSLPVKIIFNEQHGIKLAGEPEEAYISACINPGDSVHNVFRVKAYFSGSINVSVIAEVDSNYPGECGPEILLNRRDVIVKPLRVQIEGYPAENIKSEFICLEENSNMTFKEIEWNLELPYDVIPDSTKYKILIDNDILGLAIKNFDSLLKVPTGCGEQIMSKLAPNLYALRYLSSMDELTDEVLTKANNNMKIGYERILQYRHSDGSFSAFGPAHGQGSIFLTSFVVRTLSLASKYVYIDSTIINDAANWIMQKQLENGCFPSTSHVFQYGISDNGNENTGLTAYVLISLLEANITIPETVQKNAKFCLRGYNNLDKYNLALSTYALTLLNWTEEIDRSIERLLEVANRFNSMLWWENPDSMSSSIEMTSYVILSLLATQKTENIAVANHAARWLTTRRNEYGGYYSTQDTVVALDALTKYASVVKSHETNLTLFIQAGEKQLTYRIRDKDKLKTKQLNLRKFSPKVQFNITGKGCMILQSVLRYNMPQIISSEAFKLNISVNSVSTIDKCSVAKLNPCISYVVPNKKSNMAILEVHLPSGYRADRNSLHELVKKYNVKKFEEIENKVILYFTELNGTKLCTPFLINENSVVESRSPAVVKLYDYYTPEISVSTSYETPNCVVNGTELNDVGYQQDASYREDDLNVINRIKKSGLNPDFVDKDLDLDVPEGIEGPKEVRVKPPPNAIFY